MAYFELLRAVAESVQKFSECPVCQMRVRIPFKQCPYGHIACSECVKAPQCPTCKSPRLTENPENELNLLRVLPKLCRYSKDGCTGIVVTNEDDHELLCDYRPASCRETGCKEVVPLIRLLEHYEAKHEERVVSDSKWCKERLVFEGNIDTNAKSDIYTPVCFSNMFLHYWIVSRNNWDKKQMEFKVVYIRNVVYDDIFLQVSVGDGRPYLYIYSFRPTEVDALNGLKIDGNDEFEDQFCMRVPYEAVKRLADDKGKLKLKITILFNVENNT